MKTVSCLCNVLHVGELYLTKGKTAEVSEELAAALVKAKYVEIIAAPDGTKHTARRSPARGN